MLRSLFLRRSDDKDFVNRYSNKSIKAIPRGTGRFRGSRKRNCCCSESLSRSPSLMLITFSIFFLCGCCGIGEFPTSCQVRSWVHQEIQVGENADDVKKLLKEKGFFTREEYVQDKVIHRVISGERRVGTCGLNMTYDYIVIIAEIDNSRHVSGVVVRDETRPGI